MVSENCLRLRACSLRLTMPCASSWRRIASNCCTVAALLVCAVVCSCMRTSRSTRSMRSARSAAGTGPAPPRARSNDSTCNTITAASAASKTKNSIEVMDSIRLVTHPVGSLEEGIHQAHAQFGVDADIFHRPRHAAQPLVAFLGADGEWHVAHAQARMAVRLLVQVRAAHPATE